MTIYTVFVISKAGSLIYDYYDSNSRPETEKTFSYPLELMLKIVDENVVVDFGEQDGIKVGHSILSINGVTANKHLLEDGREIFEVLANEDNYPINIKFGRSKLNSNQRIVLASMFHSMFAIAIQLSPEHHSSGIEVLDTDTFRLHCYQTMTGVKFVVVTDPKQPGVENLLRKIHEIYADFALKNPFYSIDQPIRCDLFDSALQSAVETIEKFGTFGGS